MILYPTETVYGLGVPVFDVDARAKLYTLKERASEKSVSWLVRSISDIAKYADIDERAEIIASHFLPGPLTLVLPLKQRIREQYQISEKTAGFRISSDPIAGRLIADFMEKYNTPLTCTSANVSGLETLSTPQEILVQFGTRACFIETIFDDGPRIGTPSTVVQISHQTIEIMREGAIETKDILDALGRYTSKKSHS